MTENCLYFTFVIASLYLFRRSFVMMSNEENQWD